MAETALVDGCAWAKFQAICRAQGGLREPPRASLVHAFEAVRSGRVAGIDNRKLARVAKLAGAPGAKAAGIALHARVGDRIEPGEPLFSIHAETPGELAYAMDYVTRAGDILQLVEGD
jgi:thymidine phosphorylase